MMQVPKDLVRLLQDVYRRDFGYDVTDEEAERDLINFAMLLELILNCKGGSNE